VRPSFAAFTTMKKPLTDMANAKAEGNWYKVGLNFAFVWKFFFDGSLDN